MTTSMTLDTIDDVTDDVVDFLEAADPLGRDVPLPHVLDTMVVGLPVRFESNSRFVVRAATETFGAAPTVARAFAQQPLAVRVVVHAGAANGDGTLSPVRAWAPEPALIMLHGPDTVALADAARGTGVAYISREQVARRAHFRHAVLETLTLVLVAHRDRQPVHAAAVGRDGAAVLLCGASGAGKSTLAYAAHLAGLTVLSDDVVWIQLEPRMRMWGRAHARRIHLLPDARERFPTLASATPVALANGKCKIVIDLGTLASAQPITVDRITVCLVEHTNGPTTVSRVSAETIRTALAGRPEPGFDRYLERLETCARALGAGGGWRLSVSYDPKSAVPHLRTMLDALGGAP